LRRARERHAAADSHYLITERQKAESFTPGRHFLSFLIEPPIFRQLSPPMKADIAITPHYARY